MSIKQFASRYRLPDKKNLNFKGQIRKMEKKDISAVMKLFNKHQEKYKIRHKMNQDDIIHFLLPKENIVWTYVIENDVEGKMQVTDFFALDYFDQKSNSRSDGAIIRSA